MSDRAFTTTIILVAVVGVALVAADVLLAVFAVSEYLQFAVAMAFFALILIGSYGFVIRQGATRQRRGRSSDGGEDGT